MAGRLLPDADHFDTEASPACYLAVSTLATSGSVVDQLDMRGVLSVPVQSDGRPVGTLDVHATSRGLVGRS